MSPRPGRVAISLAPGERDALARVAHEVGEPISTTAGRLLRAALADHGAQLDAPPARRSGPTRTRRPKPPASVPAAEAIERLRKRYPVDLRHAPADLSADTHIAEQLAALAAWREDLDSATEANPRELLAFGHELRSAAAWLQDRARRGR
jgi:hypothetical protein